MYHALTLGDCVNVVSGGGSGGCGQPKAPRDILAWSVDIRARLNDPATWWSPYVLAGGAVYGNHNSYSSIRANHAGFQAGLGFDARFAKRTALFVEWRYLSVAPGGLAPVIVGMRF
jgi:opacity protein-like surface antigen